MADRTALIQRKQEVIGALAQTRRRLAAARQSVAPRHTLSQLEAEVAHLQQQERQLRLEIDRTAPAPLSFQLRPKQDSMQTHFDVFITAGYDRNKVDPLSAITGQPQKAMVTVANAPMLWHVVRALDESGVIGEIVIVGLDEEHHLDFGRPIHYIADQGSMWKNQRAGIETLMALNSQNRYVLATGADTPLLTGDMVRWFIEACRPIQKQIYWGIVPREVMEATFPLSKRSYLRLREGQFCSGDLFLSDLEAGARFHQNVEPFFTTRKSVVQQLRLLGLRPLFDFVFRRLSLAGMKSLGKQKFKITVQEIVLPFAEAGMDVDKPHQLVQVQEYLVQHPDHPANTRRTIAVPPTQSSAEETS